MKNIFINKCFGRINLFLIALIIVSAQQGYAGTILNGRIVAGTDSGEKLFSVTLQLNTTTGSDDLGGATFVISFDTTQLSFTSSPENGKDYFFHNFENENYLPAKVTKVLGNQVWLSILLNKDNNGIVVSGDDEWTDLATLYFIKKVIDVNEPVNWETESPFWSVFDGDNQTLWEKGSFNNVSESGEDGSVPAKYSLAQNYPNPFNPETTIEFSINKSDYVKLVVYNAIGEEVKTLINEKLNKGTYKINFNASHLASGLYIYKLHSGNFTSTKKMILIK